MTGSSLSDEMIENISDITGIERSKIVVMEIKDIKFYLSALTMRTNDLSVFEDETQIDTATGLEILESLNNL